jgi:hypothetical protein
MQDDAEPVNVSSKPSVHAAFIPYGLSVQTRFFLERIGIFDVDSLLLLPQEELRRTPGCQKRIITEIETFQLRIQSMTEAEIPPTPDSSRTALTPEEVFRTVKEGLSLRGVRVLESFGVNNLSSFLQLSKTQLLNKCGKLTTKEILHAQSNVPANVPVNEDPSRQPHC